MQSQIDTIKQQRVERLEQIRETTKMTQSGFAKYLDLEAGSYSDIKRIRCGISQSVLKKLEKKLNVNIEWLLTGIGEMTVNDVDDAAGHIASKILIPYQKQSSDDVNTYIDRLFKLIERRDDQIEKLMHSLKEYEQESQNKLNKVLTMLESIKADK